VRAVLYSHDAARDQFFLVHVRWGCYSVQFQVDNCRVAHIETDQVEGVVLEANRRCGRRDVKILQDMSLGCWS
jgi:hypothetical protein